MRFVSIQFVVESYFPFLQANPRLFRRGMARFIINEYIRIVRYPLVFI